MNEHERPNPFPGYRPFDVADAGVFFGREAEAEAVESRLAAAALVTIAGAKEIGKSSLARAGVIPRLRQRGWRVAVLRPGEDPIGNLGRALSAPEALALPAGEVEGMLRSGPAGLDECARAARLEPATPLLVFVDQLDELVDYRRCRETLGTAADDEAFVALLVRDRQPSGVVRTLLTMRAGALQTEPTVPLPSHLNQLQLALAADTVTLQPMSREQLTRAVTAPVEASGARVAPDLVAAVVVALDPAADAGHLPLVQHALMRAWEARTSANDELTLRHFDAVGGVHGALFRHADEVCAADPRPELVDHVVRSATEYVDGFFVRRPIEVQEIAQAGNATSEDVEGVVTRLQARGRTFLKPASTGTLGPTSLVDISYDSFAWLRRRRWSYVTIPTARSSGETEMRRPAGGMLTAATRAQWPWAAAALLVGGVAISLALGGHPWLAVVPPALFLALSVSVNWPFVRRYYWPLLLTLATGLVLVLVFPRGGPPGSTTSPLQCGPGRVLVGGQCEAWPPPLPDLMATFRCGPGLMLVGTRGTEDCEPIPTGPTSNGRSCGPNEILVGATGGTVECARVPTCGAEARPGLRIEGDRIAIVCQPLLAGPQGQAGRDGDPGPRGNDGIAGRPGADGRSASVPTCDAPGERLVGTATGTLECRPMTFQCPAGEVLTGIEEGQPLCQPFPLAPTIQFGDLPRARPGFEYRLGDGNNDIEELGLTVNIGGGRVSVTDTRSGEAILPPTAITSGEIRFPDAPLPPGVFGYTLQLSREGGGWRVVIRRCAGACRDAP